MRPTLRQLEYLVAVVDRGGFHAAARACHVSQPGLSAQIKQLEELLGVCLFERDRRTVLVTREGEALARRAREILLRTDDLVEAAQARSGPLTGRIRLDVIPTIAPYLLPRVLPQVRDRFPGLRLQLHEGRTEELLARLQRGQSDLVLLALEARLGDVERLALFEDPFVLAVPTPHPLAGRRRVSEEEIAREPILLLDDGHCLRDQALSLCRRVGGEERSDFRASSLPTLVQMVAGGAGLTLLPELARDVEGRTQGISLVGFRKPVPHRTVGLAWRRTSPRADEFALLAESLTP